MNDKPQRFALSSLSDVKEHTDEISLSRPFVTKDFAVIHGADPLAYVGKVFHPHVPYRMYDYRFLVFRHARVRVVVNLMEMNIADNTIGYLAPGSILQIEEFSEASDVSAVVLSEDYLRLVMGGRLPSALSSGTRDFYIKASAREAALLSGIIGLLRRLVDEPSFSPSAAASLIAAVVNDVCSLRDRQDERRPRTGSRGQELFRSFIALVNEFGYREHTLRFYADRLCVTERYLGTLVMAESGVGAKEWIDRSITAEAKVQLKHTQTTISQLAEHLSFPAPSLFCRHFKRMTGITPREYREQADS